MGHSTLASQTQNTKKIKVGVIFLLYEYQNIIINKRSKLNLPIKNNEGKKIRVLGGNKIFKIPLRLSLGQVYGNVYSNIFKIQNKKKKN